MDEKQLTGRFLPENESAHIGDNDLLFFQRRGTRLFLMFLVLASLAACDDGEPSQMEGQGIVRPRNFVAALPDIQEYKTPEGRILQKWIDLGGVDEVGEAIDEIRNIIVPPSSKNPEALDLIISYQKFVNGVILYTADYGSVYLSHPIFDRWQSVWASDLKDFWLSGQPTADYSKNEGYDEGIFQHATIIVEGATTRFVHPVIYGRYADLRKHLGLPRSELAVLRSDENGNIERAYQRFENGEIYWDIQTGAYGLWGALWHHWKETATTVEAALNSWGFPLSDVTDIIGGDMGSNLDTGEPITLGQALRFEKGTFYRALSADTSEVYEVTGELARAYDREGGATGWLGFPVSSKKTNQQGKGYQEFENGILIQPDFGSENAIPMQTLRFVFEHIKGKGGDCVFDICGGMDLDVRAEVSASSAQLGTIEYPRFARRNNDSEMAPNWTVPAGEAWKVTSDLVIDVTIQAWDVDDLSGDDFLGKVEHTYSIDNFWGFGESEEYSADGEDRDLHIKVLMATRSETPFDSSDFRGNMFWSFLNFSTPDNKNDKIYRMKPRYEDFARTFEDVDPYESTWLHPFNDLYYNIFYKKALSKGNCFGMSLESIYAQRGQSIYGQPIFRYFPDTAEGIKPFATCQEDQLCEPKESHKVLMRQMNVRQAAQLSQSSILWVVRQFVTGMAHSPLTNFYSTLDEEMRGNSCVLNIFKDSFGGDGHAVRPYRWEENVECFQDSSRTCSRIYIADPNYPKGKSCCHDDDEQVIEIDNVEHTWVHLGSFYEKTGEYEYKGIGGSFSGGGIMFYTPYSILSQPLYTPYDLVGSVLALVGPAAGPIIGAVTGAETGAGIGALLGSLGLFMLIVGSDADVNQVTDEQERTLFEMGLSAPPTRWSQLRHDKESRIPDFAPIPLSGAEGETASAKLFAGYRSGSTHTYDVVPAAGVAAGTPLEMTFHSADMASHWVIPATPGKPDKITAHAIDFPGKAVSIQINEQGESKEIEWIVGGTEKHRWLKLTNLGLVPGQRIKIELDNAGYESVIVNDGPATTGRLQVQAGPGAEPVEVGEIQIPSGKTQFQFERPETTLTLSNEVYGNEGWLMAPVTITLEAVDYSSKGIDFIEYSQDQINWTRYSGPFTCATEGVTTLYYRAWDNNSKREITRSQEFKIDLQKPVIELSADKSVYTRVKPLIVQAKASDPIPGSGLVRFEPTFDGQPVVDGEQIELLWLALGTHRLEAQAEDLVGWVSDKSVQVELVATTDSLAALIELLYQLGEIDSHGIKNSLLAKVRNAQKSVKKGNLNAARNQLSALTNELSAQWGKHISARAAQLLLGDVNFVIANL